jgi:hypothetical protein
MTSAAARMLAHAYPDITPPPKWQYFALPFGSLLLCLKGKPNSTFMVKQAWIAASL